MGLAASQARLLSITARLSDNELHSQQISNSKMRLADKTQEASQEYINALNATKLMYTTYDAEGGSTQTELTPAIMYQYSDVKNQYGISNTSGQLLVSSTDAMNFEASDNVNDFVQAYGVALVDNPQYELELQTIFGSNYEEFFNTETGSPTVDLEGMGVGSWIGKANNGMTEQEYNSWKNSLNIPVSGTESGSYGSLITNIKNAPSYPGDEPVAPSAMPDFKQLAASYNGSACYGSVNGNSATGVWHIEHNLCLLIWGANGLGADTGTITNSDGTITINAKMDELTQGSIFTGFANGSTGSRPAQNLLNALDEVKDYECVQEVIQSLIDLYCDVVNYYEQNSTREFHGTIDRNGATTSTPSELYSRWQQFYEDLEGLEAAGKAEYDKMYDEYEKQKTDWEADWKFITDWQNETTRLFNEYIADLENLPMSKIPDEEDPKTSWYVNLWHRMNGESDYKSAEGEKGTYYKQLDDNLLTSSEWLQFALEHGVVTLEKVQYVDEAESDTGLSTTKWMATSYSSCTDISETEDEVAIAKAEAEYNKKLKEIEAKDKKYDNDIKKLDTEHNALQTEYESVKSVIEKNTERSFKAFS